MSEAKIKLSAIPSISNGFRLQFEEAQDSYVLLYPEGMVKLNESAAEILKRCDGARNVKAVIDVLEADFNEKGLQADVISFLQIATEQKWVSISDE